MIRHAWVVASLLAGCAGSSAPAVSPTPGASATTPDQAVRAYVARRLRVPIATVRDQSTGLTDHDHGTTRAFLMTTETNWRLRVRGWVTADGTVITPNQNLGALLAALGVWAKPPPMKLADLADTVAHELVWAYSYFVEVDRPDPSLPGPSLVLNPDGSGTLTFFSRSISWSDDPEAGNDDDGGGGGGGPGGHYYVETVVLTRDHHATLRRVEYEAPAR
jgi:hypothetical protein